MAKRKPLVSQHLENISLEGLENYEEQRLHKARVRAIRGEYAHIRTSSEMFAFKKQEEIKQEE